MSYASARDLPSFLESERQLKALRLFAWPMRARIKSIERDMHELAGTVDAFYELLSDKHWIFHDHLSLTAVRALLAEAPEDPDQAEKMLIDHYNDREHLRLMLGPLRDLSAMRRRLPLVEKAQEDYFAGRFYSCVQVLLSVMDGFVNEFETVRRGLHARTPEELHAWDSVVGHHRGLQHAHRTFTKGRTNTKEEPVYELYRNGIVHGSILNYDNIIVATKAWNRLFAVADWARATQKEQQEVAEPPTWSELGKQLKDTFGQLIDQAQINRLNEQWSPQELLSDSEAFTAHPAYDLSERLLTYWVRSNYGSLSDLISRDLHTKHGKAARSEVRRVYQDLPLASFEIVAVGHDMPAACTVTVRLTHPDGRTSTAGLRWIREDDRALPRPDPWPGQWRLSNWEPWHLIARGEG
ncbi:hypothetical protein OHA84_38130 (plasmid) [Streptomyces sp. NBC_00513]|uniref:hypothetical protein n=1 Tax=unclassified Streptomyces TaxID=2593676 RepID=UPI00225A79F5|nr:hypothetical protein [Streptomyces sp. NBC_00424]MCX5079165.1 hypothetical protein [Streptomyces sp. NBC_00424]WUD39026.1 hypothetical protein OHA84_00015 [Streptomyces sp. NBC_00513]WUD45703.1 hypothetical protein OHA84_37285 [Streptomyces sp. NBC_00513]WUD46352.1 hypothetical protein OHA84_38130 [Streptomyces sp. NBC_00513]